MIKDNCLYLNQKKLLIAIKKMFLSYNIFKSNIRTDDK